MGIRSLLAVVMGNRACHDWHRLCTLRGGARRSSSGKDQVAVTDRDRSPAHCRLSVLFGIGWGLVGLCPGPAIANLATLSTPRHRVCCRHGARYVGASISGTRAAYGTAPSLASANADGYAGRVRTASRRSTVAERLGESHPTRPSAIAPAIDRALVVSDAGRDVQLVAPAIVAVGRGDDDGGGTAAGDRRKTAIPTNFRRKARRTWLRPQAVRPRKHGHRCNHSGKHKPEAPHARRSFSCFVRLHDDPHLRTICTPTAVVFVCRTVARGLMTAAAVAATGEIGSAQRIAGLIGHGVPDLPEAQHALRAAWRQSEKLGARNRHRGRTFAGDRAPFRMARTVGHSSLAALQAIRSPLGRGGCCAGAPQRAAQTRRTAPKARRRYRRIDLCRQNRTPQRR